MKGFALLTSDQDHLKWTWSLHFIKTPNENVIIKNSRVDLLFLKGLE